METVKAYVLVNKYGTIISREFGSMEAALKASKYKRFEDQFHTIAEIESIVEKVEISEINYGRIAE